MLGRKTCQIDKIIRSLENELIYLWVDVNVIPACLNTVINLVDKLVVKEFMKV